MATEAQYGYFKFLYEEEERAARELADKAKIYLGVISAFLVAILLKTEDAVKSAESLGIPFSFVLVEAVGMSAALVCVVVALRVKTFEAVTDGLEILDKYEDVDPTDEEFYVQRIADFAVASSRNRKANARTSTWLYWAGALLIAGVVYILVGSAFAIWRSNEIQKHPEQKRSAETGRKRSADQDNKRNEEQ